MYSCIPLFSFYFVVMTMQKFWLWLALVFFSTISISAQGIVRGKISDENGESLIGVSVFLKDNPSIGASTDLDGQYSLKLPDAAEHVLNVVYISYETIEATVAVPEGEVLVMDFVLLASSVALGEVEVVAKQERRSQYYMESIKKKSANTLDYMSGDMMSKIGDNNVSAAIPESQVYRPMVTLLLFVALATDMYRRRSMDH
jgi:hypothetical protein